MSTENLREFLEALDRVKDSFKCCVCGELCIKPVTISECLHLICSDHLENRDSCPKCLTALERCSLYKDEKLESCIESTKVLDKVFEGHRNEISKQESTPVKPSKNEKSKVKKKDPIKQKGDSHENKSFEAKKESTMDIHSTNAESKTKKKDTNEQKTDSDTNEIIMVEEVRTINTRSKDEISKAKKTKSNIKKNNSLQKENLESEEESIVENRVSDKSKTKKKDSIEQKRNIKGETMLHRACILNNLEQVKKLIDQGACVNTKDNAGWTPLHEAVQNGRHDIVQLLLDNNALVNVPGPGNETPLHEAIRYKHSEIAQLLVKYGADVEARNCKGETPLHLADEDMTALLNAALENVVQSQSANVTLMSLVQSEIEFEDIRIYNASQFKTVANKLKSLLKKHENLNLESKLSNKVTHLIVDTLDEVCESSLEVLQAIVYGIWVIDSKWVTKSTDKKLESFEEYEVKSVSTTTNGGPNKSRFNKYKQLPGLFNGCHFYLHNFHGNYEISKSLVVNKAILTKLITTADGTVLRRVPNPESIPESEKLIPYHAKKDGLLAQCSHYIIFKDIYEPMYNMKHLKALSIGWLIECIEKYELCEPW